MRRVVIDTNVLISSIIEPKGKPAEIMNLCFSETLQFFYTAGIFDEYKRVLSYKRLNIKVETQAAILAAIKEAGILVNPAASDIPFPDDTDRVFYDTALESDAVLITGNKKHFPDEPFIVSPTEFLSAGII
jgi:putative PIN family toxin of toxin-antitoxin system